MASAKQLHDDRYLGFEKYAREMYEEAIRHLVCGAYEERAEFPLYVGVMNADDETWNAVVTIKGDEFVCKHLSGVVMTLAFPLLMVAADSRNDIVASMEVALVDDDPSRN